MFDVELNYWAILVAGIASYFVGMIWYMALSKPWMKAAGFEGKTKEEMKKMGGAKSYIGSFLVGLVMAFVLAHVVDLAGETTLWGGIVVGAVMWLGFVGTATKKSMLWEQKPKALWLINNGDHLIGLVVMGAILALWQ